MKKISQLCIISAFLSPLVMAEDWSEEQKEVLAWEEACISETNHAEWIKCFHEDFIGWGMNFPAPTTKSEREKVTADGFENFETEVLLFKPLSVQIYGNTAVINYIDSVKITNKATDEVAYATSLWTDIAIKERGTWYWIADHGSQADNN